MGRNVLLIAIDTARADIVHEMIEKGTLPNLQELANNGRQYTTAISQSPWTLPSHASLFTGEYPNDHGAHAGTKLFDPEGAALAELLRDDGYRTLAISGNIWVSPEFGFDAGFEDFSMKYDRFWSGTNLSGVSKAPTKLQKAQEFANIIDHRTLFPTLANGIYTKLIAGRKDKGAALTTRRTKKWIRKHGRDEQKFFYFINYLEPHLEYDPDRKYAKPFLSEEGVYDRAVALPQRPWQYITGHTDYSDEEIEMLKALYRGELAYIDTKIGELLESLERSGIRDETAIIIVGDHGENIGEHGLMDHQYSLHQTLVHVPLIISDPIADEEIIEAPVETRDVFPTVLDIAGIDLEQGSAKSTNSLLETPERTYACSEYLAPQPSMESLAEAVNGQIPNEAELDRTLRAIQNEQWKLIEASDKTVELYDLAADPAESNDISTTNPETADALRSELEDRGLPIEYQETGAHDAAQATKDRLENLGYI